MADIRVSNVDKKTDPGQQLVRLCNYMNVYSHEYVTAGLEFMEASATSAEIERFGLHLGDVVITKDSETPDDIGIAAVVAEQIDRLVCGYHLALIRPKRNELDPTFLAKQLSSSRVARYFAVQASGSTRYGLPVSAIESVEIPTPPIPEQEGIAEILSTLDRAIDETDASIVKQKRINTGLMNDLLARGVDEHGRLRTELTHEFKDTELGRIPAEWRIAHLSELARVDRGKFTHRPRDDARFYGGPWPFIQTGDVTSRIGGVVDSYTQTLSARGVSVSKEFPQGTIAITIAANIADTAILGLPMFFPDSVVGAVVYKPNNIRFVEMAIRRWKPILERMAPQSAQRNINLKVLRPLLIATPGPDEQARIAHMYDAAQRAHQQLIGSGKKLQSLKAGLMEDLLTGRKRLNNLVTSASARGAAHGQQ